MDINNRVSLYRAVVDFPMYQYGNKLHPPQYHYSMPIWPIRPHPAHQCKIDHCRLPEKPLCSIFSIALYYAVSHHPILLLLCYENGKREKKKYTGGRIVIVNSNILNGQ